MDNGLYGIEQFLIDEQILKKGDRFYRDRVQAPSAFDVLPCWDYVKLAESFGGKGLIVSTLAQLESALEEATRSHDVPVLIAVKLDPHDLPEAIEAVVRAPRPDEHASFTSATSGDEAKRSAVALDAFD
jgi:TPP-dependent trihydroxycyclohexane-1,2-dione (THcHDO) dehydratase